MFDAWGSGEWAFAVIFLVQFGAVVWIIATMARQVKDLETRVATVERHNIGENLATIKAKLDHITKWIDNQN